MTWNDLIKPMAVRQIHLTVVGIVKPLGSPLVLVANEQSLSYTLNIFFQHIG